MWLLLFQGGPRGGRPPRDAQKPIRLKKTPAIIALAKIDAEIAGDKAGRRERAGRSCETELSRLLRIPARLRPRSQRRRARALS